MNSIKFAILSIVLGLVSMTIAQEEDFDLEKITTNHGRIYRDILILDADKHGMLFRHRAGIAKVGYSQLSMNLRMLYEPISEDEPEEGGEVAKEIREDGSEFESLSNLKIDGPLILTARSRVTVPVSNLYLRFPYSAPCCRQIHWQQHWPRYHPAHALAVPACRELAIRDFLYATNLLSKPPGIFTYPLPRHGPYGFRH